ncbi:MAG: hypothetical protein Q6J68_02155, partial [Thermostichales cyanobacterium SZTDM-1c_bins_54]
MAGFDSRLKQFTERLTQTTRLGNIFSGEQQPSEGQALARNMQELGDFLLQCSQVVAEIEILNPLYNRLHLERDELQRQKVDLESRVFDLQQERNEIEPQVMYLREQLNQVTLQLEQTE